MKLKVIYGLLLTDGHIYLNKHNTNKGKVFLEVSTKDQNIIDKLCNIIPNSHKRYRTRNTNFKLNYSSCIFENSKKEFRNKLFYWGIPNGKKSNTADVPKIDYKEIDFWRGVIDGDGSLGITSNNKLFISLVTKSEFLKIKYLNI